MKKSQIAQNNFSTIRSAIAEVLEREETSYTTDVILEDGETRTHNYYGTCTYTVDFDFVISVTPGMKQAVEDGEVEADELATEILENAIANLIEDEQY